MLLNIIIGSIMIVVTTGIHAVGMVLVFEVIRSKREHLIQRLSPRTRIYWLGGIILLLFFVLLMEV